MSDRTLHPTATTVSTNGVNLLAILGFILSFPMNIVGLVLSIIALVQIRTTHERGKRLAIAGIIVGSFWIIVLAAALIAHVFIGGR
jgi:hypothetical protein